MLDRFEATRDQTDAFAATEPLLALLDAHLQKHAYMGGDSFGMADIPLGCEMHRWWGMRTAQFDAYGVTRQELQAFPNVQRWFGQARWPYAQRQAIELFWLLQRDRSGTPAPGRLAANEDATDAADLNARWLGARISGEHRDSAGWRLSWRADAALLRGSERLTAWSEQPDGRLAAGATTRRRVRGQALDVGALLRLPLPATPTLSLGWARGSGGERSAVLDANFRQTGLHENKSRLGGVKRWRSYGELLRPELSNLAVTSVGLGLRLLDNSSLELVHHGYRQPAPSTLLSSTRLSSAPLGLGSDIGHETDLLLALREWSQWELTLALARFRPGDAFAANRRDAAYSLELGVALNF